MPIEAEESPAVESPEVAPEAPEVEAPASTEPAPEAAAEEDADDVVISIGDAPAPEDKPSPPAEPWVKELRKKQREDARRIWELEQQLKASQPKPEAPTLGKKPTMSDDGIDYDEAKYEAAVLAWHEQKRKVEETHANARKTQETQAQAHQDRLAAYAKARTDLKASDFEDAELLVTQKLSVLQQNLLLRTKAPATLVLALGRNPAKATELASISDPVEFAIELGKLEAAVKVTTKNKPPPPEKPISGSGRSPTSSDQHLERLREKADKTGDYTEVAAYKANLRKKGK